MSFRVVLEPVNAGLPFPTELIVTDAMVERAARALYEQGMGFDIDADPQARGTMLTIMARVLAAAFSEEQHSG